MLTHFAFPFEFTFTGWKTKMGVVLEWWLFAVALNAFELL